MLQANRSATDCVPCDAALNENFEADKLNQLVGK
jgi:serine O-acetyltransferase